MKQVKTQTLDKVIGAVSNVVLISYGVLCVLGLAFVAFFIMAGIFKWS